MKNINFHGLAPMVFVSLCTRCARLLISLHPRSYDRGFRFLEIKITHILSKYFVEYFLLSFIIMGALGVRLYKINNPIADWHSWRQADTASVSWFYTRKGIDLLHPRYHDISKTATGFENPEGWRFVEFPIYNAIHAYAYLNIGRLSFEIWGRLLSVFASLVSLVLLYFIGKRFLGIAGGLLSSFFFAFLPFNIYFSRVILPEPTTVAVILAALWFFITWIDRGKWWYLALSAIFFAVMLLMKPYTVFWGIPFIYLAISKFGLKGLLLNGKLWIYSVAVFIPLLYWRAWMNQFFEGIPHWKWAFNGDNIRFRPAFFWWIFEERLGKLILGSWGLVPFVFGFLKESSGNFPFFVHSVFLSQVLYFTVVATASVRHDYYQILAIPAVCLTLAAGSILIWNLKVGYSVIRRLLLVGSIALGFTFSFYQVKEFYKINHPEIVLAGQAVQRLTPDDSLVIAPYMGDTAFLYQTRRRGWAHITWPMDTMVKRLGAQYFVSVNFDAQTKEVMEKYQVLEKTNEYVVVKLQ